jgi:hypothetical protein
MPGSGLTGVICVGGVQPAAAVGRVPTGVPAVTPPAARVAGGLVEVVLVAQAVRITELAIKATASDR